MVEPAGIDVGNGAANAPAIVEGILDLLAGGEGTPDAERWAQVCTNSGKCIPACNYGINPRFMVNMARIAAKAKLGDAEVRRAAHRYFNTMLAPDVVARLNPPLRPAGEYGEAPDIVF
jgi:heterodisulfide reductase subunit D